LDAAPQQAPAYARALFKLGSQGQDNLTTDIASRFFIRFQSQHGKERLNRVRCLCALPVRHQIVTEGQLSVPLLRDRSWGIQYSPAALRSPHSAHWDSHGYHNDSTALGCVHRTSLRAAGKTPGAYRGGGGYPPRASPFHGL